MRKHNEGGGRGRAPRQRKLKGHWKSDRAKGGSIIRGGIIFSYKRPKAMDRSFFQGEEMNVKRKAWGDRKSREPKALERKGNEADLLGRSVLEGGDYIKKGSEARYKRKQFTRGFMTFPVRLSTLGRVVSD